MTLLLIVLLVVVLLALFWGPTYVRRSPRRRVVETTYEDTPLSVDEDVEVRRTRRVD